MIRLPTRSPRAAERSRLATKPGIRRPAPLRIENATGEEATVYLYDSIGWLGVEAQPFVSDLAAITAGTIRLRINSPGGDVFAGTAIYNALREHGARVITQIDGVAASIASIIALAGDEVHIAEGAFFMIHNPFMVAIGDAEEMRRAADLLDKVRGQLAAVYVRKTGMDLGEVESLMDEETWFTAEEAVDAGFADQVAGDEAAEASFDLSVFNHVPAELAGHTDAGEPRRLKTVRDFEGFLRDEGGFSRSAAAAIARGGFKGQSNPREEDGEPDSVAAIEQLIATLKN